ncbi:MAG: ABC transporter permease [Aureliella sp.]
MKPYIGILIDSFWEAVNNKVLWALLIGWSILLVCLAPFGYVSERSFQLSSNDIGQRTQLIKKLAKGIDGQGSESIQAFATALDDEFASKISKASKDNGPFIRASELAEELNEVLKSREIFSEEAFPTAKRRKRLEPLIETPAEELAESDVEELNRELLQLAFPLELSSPGGEKLWLGYAGFKIGSPLPVNRRQMREFLEPVVLQVIIKLGLAVLAVFIAIIVTSPIIPDTFRSGSLHLLLSKPISRIWLYLSKFFGGTIFVLVNIAFVLIGLYLIAGLRFEIWNEGLLLCIPLLLFVFIIFYAVSGLAGLLWGNAIVCVVCCMLFWFSCFCFGFARGLMQPSVEINSQITRIKKIDDQLTAVTENGAFNVWNEEFGVWQPGIESEGGGPRRTYGPIYDAEHGRVLVKSFIRNPFGPAFARSRKLSIISVDDEADSTTSETLADKAETPQAAAAGDEADTEAESELKAGEREEDTVQGVAESVKEARNKPLWSSDPGPEIPAQLFDIVRMGPEVIAVCRGGLYRLDLEQLEMIEASEKSLFGLLNFGSWASNTAFKNIAPSGYILSENSNAAATQDGSGLVVFSSGKIDLLTLNDDGQFQVAVSTELKDGADNTEATLVQMNQDYCVIIRDGLPVKILDSELATKSTIELDDEQEVKQIAWVPGKNQLTIVTHSGDLLLLDCDNETLSDYDIPVSGKISSADWISKQELWVGVQPNAAALIDTSTMQVKRSLDPKPSTLESIYNWGVYPLYVVLPKPAALDDAMLYVLSGNETQSLNGITNDLQAAQLELDVWTPIFSNLGFVIFTLGVSCLYVARKEF